MQTQLAHSTPQSLAQIELNASSAHDVLDDDMPLTAPRKSSGASQLFPHIVGCESSESEAPPPPGPTHLLSPGTPYSPALSWTGRDSPPDTPHLELMRKEPHEAKIHAGPSPRSTCDESSPLTLVWCVYLVACTQFWKESSEGKWDIDILQLDEDTEGHSLLVVATVCE